MLSVKKKLITVILISVFLALAITNVKPEELEWSLETQLTTDPKTDWNPSTRLVLQASDGKIWVVWGSNRFTNYDIFYKTSSDGGATWSADIQLTTGPSSDDTPSIAQTSDGTIWVIWRSARTGNLDIFYKTSSDGGATWSADIRLTTHRDVDITPSIAQTGDGTIWVFWASDRIHVGPIPQFEIFYKTSSDGGATWSADTRLTDDPKEDIDPSITQSFDGKIWVVWMSDRTDPRDLFYKTSSDGGATWSADTHLTTHPSSDWAPSIAQTGDGTIWVIWHSERELNYDIFYKTTSDSGATWSSDTRLTTDPSVDIQPSITQTGDGTIWVIFVSYRTENYDLWYKTATMVIHDVAITAVTPSSTTVVQGETLSIDVTVANEGTATETFDVTAFYDSSSIGTQTVTNLAPDTSATLTFNWDTTGVSPANYIISATASPILGEADLADNTLEDGTITVLPHDVAITDVTPSTTIVDQGETVSINVTTANQGFGTETFDVTVFYDSSSIGTQTVTNLAPDTSTTLTFNWDTTSVSPATYTISATASSVPGETDLADNTLEDGTVEVVIHDVAVLSVTPSQTFLIQGDVVSIDVVVANEGTLSETFDVTAFYNSKPVGTQTVTNLAPGATTTLTFNWNTKAVKPAIYTISATAGPVPGELDLTDNTFVDGTVEVVVRDVAVLSVTPLSTLVVQGDVVSIDVVVANEGSMKENFAVSVYANTTLIDRQGVRKLLPNTNTTLVFNWDTTGVSPANYIISATAEPVPREADLADNTLADGTVRVVIHDVAVLSITHSSSWTYQGRTVTINVEVKNEGTISETFNVTAYTNTTAIGTQTVTDLPPNATTLVFNWDTTGVSPANYIISATAEPVPREADLTDNTLEDGTIQVRIPGDIDGDWDVDPFDYTDFRVAFGSKGPPQVPVPEPNYNPATDLDNDGDVDPFDFSIFRLNYGKST